MNDGISDEGGFGYFAIHNQEMGLSDSDSKLKIAIHVAGGAGLDSTNITREWLETKARKKTAKRSVCSRGPGIIIFLSCRGDYYRS
jgi:hypothetical protein